MSKKYDGWVIKGYDGKISRLIAGFFHNTRREVIEEFEKITGYSWRKERRKGYVEIVKVRLVEVE